MRFDFQPNDVPHFHPNDVPLCRKNEVVSWDDRADQHTTVPSTAREGLTEANRQTLGSGLIVDPENDGCCYADGGHKGVGTSVVACVDAPPVFQASEHDLDFMALSVEHGVVGDVDFAV